MIAKWGHAALDFGPRLRLLLQATAVGLAETMPAGGERSAADGDREDRHGE